MAEHIPPGDGVPTWLAIAISVVSTVAGLKAWGPLGRWLDRRFDAAQKARIAERADMIARLTSELTTARQETQARVEENVSLRQELGEERELRMTFASDYAVLKERVEHLMRTLAEDKRDCQREIRRLNTEIRRLTNDIVELRQQHREPPA